MVWLERQGRGGAAAVVARMRELACMQKCEKIEIYRDFVYGGAYVCRCWRVVACSTITVDDVERETTRVQATSRYTKPPSTLYDVRETRCVPT